MAEYIKITYEDGEVWRARWDKKNERYCSDGAMLIVNKDSSRVELRPDSFMYFSHEELLEDKELTVEIISEEEYLKHSNNLMVEYFDDEIKRMENKIFDIKREREKYL